MAWRGNPNNPVPNIGNAKGDYSNKVVQESNNLSDKKIEINRAFETRRDTDNQKDVTIGFLDVDTAIDRQLQKFQITVVSNGQNVKVPIIYANPEKWKSIQIDGFMRDYQGKILLPQVVYSRISSEKNKNMMLFNRYLRYTVMKTYDEKNRYTPFNILMGQNVPINDVYGVVMPDHMIFTYHFIIWTESQIHANKITERLNFEAEDYWGDKRGYRFQVKIDSISHTTQLQTDKDRMVKSEFDMQVFGYLLPDVIDKFSGKENTTQKWLTPKKIVINTETVSGHILTEKEINDKKWRNVNYPNIRSDKIIPSPGIIPFVPVDENKDGSSSETVETSPPVNSTEPPVVTFVHIKQIKEGTFPVSVWTFPPPETSLDPGLYGQISFDDEFYYINIGIWKRVPKLLVNELSTVVGEIKWLSFDQDYIYVLGDLYRIPISLFVTFADDELEFSTNDITFELENDTFDL